MRGQDGDSGGDLIAAAAPAEREAAELRDRLAEIEVEQATLEAELAVFEAEFTRRVVSVLAELHAAEARILTLVADRSGEQGDQAAAREAGARARRTTGAAKAVPAPAGPVPTKELKQLFRDAAKRMHPDLAPTGEARSHAEAFMKRLNQAYRAADAEAILDLVRQWEASPFATAAPEAEEEAPIRAARRVAGLQAAVVRAERRLDEVRSSELADLMEQAMAAAATGRDYLAELRAGAETSLAAARARLAELEGAGR